jgi:hypothetical protein
VHNLRHAHAGRLDIARVPSFGRPKPLEVIQVVFLMTSRKCLVIDLLKSASLGKISGDL